MYTTIGVMSLILVYVMFIQFRIVNESDVDEVKFLREAELREMLASYKEKYKEVEEEIIETDKTIEEYKQTAKTEEGTIALLEKDRDDARMKLGITDVEGEGIEITLRETENEEISKISANDLLVIVNSLKLAGAEAISINDERIINMSDIVTINDTFIKVNGQRILAPYVIKAIGNQTYLESALLGNGGQVDEMKKLGYDVSINKVNRLKIMKYKDEIKTKYMN